MADFPTSLKSFIQQTDSVDDAQAEDVNVVYNEVKAVQEELGILTKKGGIATFTGFTSVSKAIIIKLTSALRTGAYAFEEGQVAYETDTNKLWVCTIAGTPGTWSELASTASPGAHASSHAATSIIDPLSTAAPEALGANNSSSIGAAATFARSDHQHGVPIGVPSNISTSNVAGSSGSLCRLDHVHNHPTGLGKELHHKTLPLIRIESIYADPVYSPSQGLAGYNPCVDFGPSTDQLAYFSFRVPPDCDHAADMTLEMTYCMSTAHSGNVRVGFNYDVMAHGGDATPSHARSLSETINPSDSAEILETFNSASLKIYATDYNADTKEIACCFYRNADDGADTHTGDFRLIALVLNYTIAV